MPQPESRINDLLSRLTNQSGASLVREHLEAARFNLLNSMSQEYQFDLGLAKTALADIEDKDLRSQIASFLENQAGPENQAGLEDQAGNSNNEFACQSQTHSPAKFGLDQDDLS